MWESLNLRAPNLFFRRSTFDKSLLIAIDRRTIVKRTEAISWTVMAVDPLLRWRRQCQQVRDDFRGLWMTFSQFECSSKTSKLMLGKFKLQLNYPNHLHPLQFIDEFDQNALIVSRTSLGLSNSNCSSHKLWLTVSSLHANGSDCNENGRKSFEVQTRFEMQSFKTF